MGNAAAAKLPAPTDRREGADRRQNDLAQENARLVRENAELLLLLQAGDAHRAACAAMQLDAAYAQFERGSGAPTEKLASVLDRIRKARAALVGDCEHREAPVALARVGLVRRRAEVVSLPSECGDQP